MNIAGELGAIELSIIAFSIVFFVLGALTLVIFAMKAFSVGKRDASVVLRPPKNISTSVKSGATSQQVASHGEDNELIAVITAALACELRGGALIRSVVPVSMPKGSYDFSSWIGAGRLESLQGDMPGTWN